MKNRTQKSALNETLKAEENKVMAKKPAAKSNPVKAKPPVDKPAKSAKQVTKATSKSQPKKTPAPKQVEKKLPAPKMIHDSFNMPENDYKLIAALKQKCVAANISVKKSELLVAGLKALSGMSQANLIKLLSPQAPSKK